jgi:hypothetical protein
MTKAKDVAERLSELEEAGGGVLTPEAVVEDAKAKTSPLHGYFTWDVKKAAYAHWLEQARSLIRSVRYEHRTETRVISAVAYVRNPESNADEQGYVHTEKLRDDIELSREAVAYEFARAAAALTRAREIAVVLGISEDIDLLIDGVNALRRPLLVRRSQPGAVQ